jgi:hypothetical protein
MPVATTRKSNGILRTPSPGQNASIDRDFRSHASYFGQHYTEILLLLGELPNRRGDLGRGKNCRGHLIEERLEDMMVSPIDQNDVCIAPAKSPRCGDPGKSTPNDHDAMLLGAAHVCNRHCLPRPSIF